MARQACNSGVLAGTSDGLNEGRFEKGQFAKVWAGPWRPSRLTQVLGLASAESCHPAQADGFSEKLFLESWKRIRWS